jgi:pyruvate dehydrogenase E2 component (dihydrolipoamide acetyltransferase)
MPYLEMPKLSDTMTEGTVVKWHKAVGDSVSTGDVLAEIETDKAVMELEAFDDGTLKEICVPNGGKAKVGDHLALVLGAGESAPSKSDKVAGVEKHSQENIGEHGREVSGKSGAKMESAASSVPATSAGRIKASPLAKKIAAAKGVNLGTIQGSGPGGRVVAKDLESASAQTPRAAAPATAPILPGPLPAGAKRIPLSGMRKIIAERLLASKTQIPHFYLNIEVDAGNLMRLRAQMNEPLEKAGLGKLTINDFILQAVVAAAVKVPQVNASFAGDAIIEYPDVHLSVAVAVEDGLVTPVVRSAQNKSLREISAAVKDLATRARSKKLKPEEYQGGTLTVSNLGSYGIDNFSAIINPPQAIILSIGAIVKKPVVNAQDQIVPGQRLAIGLSADHRVVDGAIGAQYLAELRQLIENPVLMLL